MSKFLLTFAAFSALAAAGSPAKANECPNLTGQYTCTSGTQTFDRNIAYGTTADSLASFYMITDNYPNAAPFNETLVADGVAEHSQSEGVGKDGKINYDTYTATLCSAQVLVVSADTTGSGKTGADKSTTLTTSEIRVMNSKQIGIHVSLTLNGQPSPATDEICTRK